MKGIITKVIEDKRFFFVDNKYFCHFDKINFSPAVLNQVEYEKSVDKNGKDIAINVKLLDNQESNIRGSGSFFEKYINELMKGYFETPYYVKKEFIVEYPKELAVLFGKDRSLNKSAQIRKYFDFCRKIEGIFKVKKDFNYVKSELPRLIYHINSAYNKKPPLVSAEFKMFIEKNVEMAIQDENNFLKGFMNHFEALIGFSNNN